jgi:hypothetical protein
VPRTLEDMFGLPHDSGSATAAPIISIPSAPALSDLGCGLPGLYGVPRFVGTGMLVPFPAVLTVSLVTLPDTTLALPCTWPAGVPSGTSFWFQDAVSGLAAVQKVSLSNAVKATAS